MTHASLFSGIGGFDYAAALLGWINIFDCEIDAFCRKVLEYHFPNSVHYGDITKQIFKEWPIFSVIIRKMFFGMDAYPEVIGTRI